MSHTLSFTVLHNLQHLPQHGPIHIPLDDLSKKSIRNALRQISDPYLLFDNSLQKYPKDEPHNFFHGIKLSGTDLRSRRYFYREHNAVNNLLKKGYYSFNNFSQFYVVAFAIDYKTFPVRSEGLPKQIINWNPT